MKSNAFRLLSIITLCVALAAFSVRWYYDMWPWRKQVQLGFSSQTFTDSSGKRYPYVLFIPYHHRLQTKHPVLLFLNGIGENGNDGVKQLSNNLGAPIWETRGRFPLICVAPQMTEDSSWTDPRSATSLAAIEMTKEVIERYGGDPDRIYLTGPSSGGAGTYALAERNPDFFAAIVPLSTGGPSRVEPFLKLPIWSLHNSGDQESLVASARSFQRRLIEAGASPIVTEYQQPGHDSWNYAYRDPALFSWLVRQRRGDRRNRTGYRLVDLELLAASPTFDGVRVDYESRTLANGSQSKDALCELPNIANQLHFEYQSTGRVACEVVVLKSYKENGAPSEELLNIRIPWAEDGSSSIESKLQNASGAPLAQRSLKDNYWNDIRIECFENQCRVQLNGWELMELTLPNDQLASPPRFALRLAQVQEGKDQRYRYLRTAISEIKPMAANSPKD